MPSSSLETHSSSAAAVQLATLAAVNKIPAAYPNRDHAVAGGLMSYGTDLADMFHQLGIYTGSILKGGQTRRPAGAAVGQVRVRHQPADGARHSASRCRRGCFPSPMRSSNEAARVHHFTRWRNGRLAACCARATAVGNAGGRASPRRVRRCQRALCGRVPQRPRRNRLCRRSERDGRVPLARRRVLQSIAGADG